MPAWGFEVGRVYIRRRDIHERFGGQHQGGISTPANHPVIFAFTGGTGRRHGYADHWTDDGVFCLFGEGQKGDMSFRGGNRAIRDHVPEGKDLLLFEMHGGGRVRFRGQFVCESWREETGEDTAGHPRRAIVFHLVPLGDGGGGPLGRETTATDFDDLRARAMAAGRPALKRSVSDAKRSYWERSDLVREYVLERAAGVCECCGREAPFLKKDGTPFLEVHHIRRLTDSGPDDPRHVAGICPNCHREAHYGRNHRSLNERLQRVVLEKEAKSDQRRDNG